MSSIKIEYTNAEGDFFEVNMESGDRSYQTVSKDRDIITEAVAAIKRAACITSQ